jgi:hypothetical protein
MRLISNMNGKMENRFWENLAMLVVIILISVLSIFIAQ